MSNTTRVQFSEEFVRAVQVRGLTLPRLAKLARVSKATVLSAANGKQVNMCSAVAISKALSDAPVIDGLDQWIAPASSKLAA